MSIETLFEDDEFEFPSVSEREMACERLLFNATEDILLAMQDSQMSRADLAKKLGQSKSHVSKLLDGTRNMTLRTLSDIAYALGAEAKVVIFRNGVDVSFQVAPRRNWTKNTDVSHVKNDTKHIVSITIDLAETKKASYDFG